MKESYFMGIDTGTNSSKGVLINSHGEIIAETGQVLRFDGGWI